MSTTEFYDVSRVVLGPLTTTFTPPASCFTAAAECETCSTGWQGQACGSDAPQGGPTDGPSCWPPTTAGAPSAQPALHGWGFYSPGVQCPSGFSTACHATAGGSADWTTQFHMASGETAVGCCPTGFTCNFSIHGGQTCRSIAGVGDSVTVDYCATGQTFGLTALTLPVEIQAVATATASSASASYDAIDDFTVYAPMIEIRWQSTDKAAMATSSAATSSMTKSTSSKGSGSAASGPTASMPAQTGQSTSGASSKDSEGGLSTGAKIAIGVVVPVVVLGALAIAGFLLWRRRKSKNNNDNDTAEPRYQHLQQSQELQGTQVHEMAENSRVQELGDKTTANHERHELPAGPAKYA